MLKDRMIQAFVKLFFIFLGLILLFIVIGLLTTAKPSSRITTSYFTNWTSNLDETVFSILFRMENRPYALLSEHATNESSYTKRSLQSLTHINFSDFKSFIGKELPGFSTYEQKVIIASNPDDEMTGMLHESGPPLEEILKDREAIEDQEEREKEKAIEIEDKVVFLYSSHNRESFLPHLPKETNPDRAYHKEVNITKVSEYLAEKLEENSIGTSFDRTDITTILHKQGWSYGKSYDASRPVIQQALQSNAKLNYVFDIHRDSLPYEKTTITHKGKTYATFLFVIGAENKGYEENLKLATQLHHLLEEKIPGLSRGVITKEGPKSNGVYNQDLLNNSLLMEIGGYDNHLDEMYRSMDVFSEVFSAYYWEATSVEK